MTIQRVMQILEDGACGHGPWEGTICEECRGEMQKAISKKADLMGDRK